MEKQEYQIMYETENKHWWYLGIQNLIKNQIQKYFKYKTNLSILDAGCGTGGNLLLLSKYGKACGLDISPLAIKYCKQRGLINIKKGSILKLPYKKNRFYLIVCMSVLYHKKVISDKKALLEFKKVLKKKGFLFGLVPALNFLESDHDKRVHTARRYTKKEITELLESTGFKIKKNTYSHFFVLPLIILKRKIFKSISLYSDRSSDLFIPPKFLNNFLFFILKIENIILEAFNLPIGNSIFFVAQNNETKT
jgi:SAM-dependent methyltransferase